ncbi:MAG TPA: biotin/lipoyl-binding protein, partial [Gemmatimonadaceae bacterium]|nr:biotin/lipoyl-binding protein [Gemmatimonadaceae bacterium]
MLSACGRDGNGSSAPPSQPPPVQVGPENIAIAERDTLRTGPSISGTLQPREAATINAEVSGSVVQTLVDRGEPVKRGQLLLRIDDVSERQNFLSARSAARSAKLAEENAAS